MLVKCQFVTLAHKYKDGFTFRLISNEKPYPRPSRQSWVLEEIQGSSRFPKFTQFIRKTPQKCQGLARGGL